MLTRLIQYVINVVLTLPAIVYLDKWGRRPSLIIGSFFMMTWLFVSGALQQYYGEPNVGSIRNDQNSAITWIVHDNRPASSAIVACSYLFVATFATTWGPTSWTYPAEIFPSKIRAKAVSLATASNWFWNMVLAFAVPPLLWNISYKMVRDPDARPCVGVLAPIAGNSQTNTCRAQYYIFGAFNAAAFIHMSLMAPETKGYTLEEMDEVFDSGLPAWKRLPKRSRLEDLEREIADGNLKVRGPAQTEKGAVQETQTEKEATSA